MVTKGFVISVFLLVMMGSMLDSLYYFVATPKSFFNVIVALNVTMFSMSLVIVYLLWVAFRQQEIPMTKAKLSSFAAVLAWNEVSMAILLRVLGYSFQEGNSLTGYLSFLGLAITNYLFLVPMIVEMAYFIFLVMKPGLGKRTAISLLLMQIFDPAIIGNSFVVLPLLIAYSAAMILAIYYVLSYVYRKRDSLNERERSLPVLFIVIVGISTAGIFQPALVSSPFGLAWLTFGISMIAAMTLYFTIVLGRFSLPEPAS